jgi:Flp pilus assembly protein CpaB
VPGRQRLNRRVTRAQLLGCSALAAYVSIGRPGQAEMLAQANSMGEISLSLRSIADGNPKTPMAETDPFNTERSSAVRVFKYGVPTRAYGVN